MGKGDNLPPLVYGLRLRHGPIAGRLQKSDRATLFHGIQVLAAAGLTAGKRVTCYEHVRLEAEQAGATYANDQTVCDGRIVTAQTWQSHPSFYREIFTRLSSRASATRT